MRRRRRRADLPGAPSAAEVPATAPAETECQPLFGYLKALGPGMMAGLADNDPAGVTTYSIVGAQTGYAQLWLLVLATFMVQAIQVTSARIGDVTQQGILHLTRACYGWRIATIAALIGVVANEATLIADTAALGAALQLLTGLPWQWFVVPSAALLMLVTMFCNFRWIRNLFFLIGLLFLSYIATAFLAHPDWGAVWQSTLVPTLPQDLPSIAAALGLLGTTISPYLLFWEAEGEREAGRTRRQLRLTVLDVTIGYVVSNVISFFIIVTTAATLYTHHRMVVTAADAAQALRPLAGDHASLLFAIGLLGAGLLAVPMFAISIGYIAAELFDWRSGLSYTPFEAPHFYAVVGAAFLSGGFAVLLGVDPVIVMFDSQILNGLLMPALIVIVYWLANDPRVMGPDRNSIYYNVWLAISFVVMTASVALLIQGLLRG